MTVLSEGRGRMWFGTEDRMIWFPVPNRGASSGGEAWNSGGGTLNGGGFQLNSYGSHRNYAFEWPNSTPARYSQTMKSYYDGTYGRGLLYFVDPLMYHQNVFPAMWADPSMGIGNEGASLVYGVNATALPTSNWRVNELPVRSALYDLNGVASLWRGKSDAVFIPIPEGHALCVGAIYDKSGAGAVFYREQSTSGGLGSVKELTPVAPDASSILNETIQGDVVGAWFWVGRNSSTASTVTLTALTGRFIPSDRITTNDYTKLVQGPWVGGQGHSGCRFDAPPTESKFGPVGGGQVGFAASFREVGSWLNG